MASNQFAVNTRSPQRLANTNDTNRFTSPKLENSRNQNPFGSAARNILGTGKQSPRINQTSPRSPFSAVNRDIVQLREKTEQGKMKDACIISGRELERIRETLNISKSFVNQSKLNMDDQLMETAAKIKKQKMQKNDMEKLEKLQKDNVGAFQMTLEQKQRQEGTLPEYMKKMDEQHDDVKGMSKYVLLGKVISIRDKQLQENQELEQEYLDNEKKLHMMMEIERLKLIKDDEEREQRRIAARQQQQKVVIDQIHEKYQQRMRDQELKERELEIMRKQTDQIAKQQEQIAKEKQEKARRALMEVQLANQQSILKKEQKKLEEKELDEEILKYRQQKEQMDLEKQAEIRRYKEAKEREVNKMIEKQELAISRVDNTEELRVQKAFEDAEKNMKIQAQAKEEKRLKKLSELEQAREVQFREKERVEQEIAKRERESFLEIIQFQQEEVAREQRIDLQKKKAFNVHQQGLNKQIEEKTEKKKQDRVDFLEEGRKMRQKLLEEQHKLEVIKDHKLQEMDKMGLNSQVKKQLQKVKHEII